VWTLRCRPCAFCLMGRFIMGDWHLTDRVKVSMLQELLIPSYMPLERFARKILDPRRVMPSVLSRKTEARIIAVLTQERDKASYADKALKPA
jgi:hypothetical protein